MSRRLAIVVAGALLLAVGIAVGGFRLSANAVATELDLARAELVAAENAVAIGDSDRAADAIESASRHASAAVAGSTGPLWTVSSALPVVGATPTAVRVTATSLDDALASLAPAIRAVVAVGPGEVLGGRRGVAMEPYQSALPALATAQEQVGAAFDLLAMAPSPASGDLVTAEVEKSRVDVARQLRAIDDELTARLVNTQIVPSLLGGDRTQSLLLMVLDPRLARGTGGVPAVWALLEADGGRVSVPEVGPADELPTLRSWPPGVDAQVRKHYGNAALQPTGMNLTPDHPTAAWLWARSWRQRTGARPDAVLSIDIPALGDMLTASGRKVRLPDGTLIVPPPSADDAESAVPSALVAAPGALVAIPASGQRLTGEEFTEYLLDGVQRAYPLDAQAPERLKATQDVVQAALIRVARSTQGEDLAAALTAQIAEGRILAWAGDTETQANIAQTPLAGSLDVGKGPRVDVATIADDERALDGYLKRGAEYRVGRCPDVSGLVDSEVEVTLRSQTPKAPANIPPGLGAAPDAGAQGLRRDVVVQIHLPEGATPNSVLVDGRPVDATAFEEQGRPAVAVKVKLPARVTRTVQVDFAERLSPAAGSIRLQPLVRDWDSTVVDRPC